MSKTKATFEEVQKAHDELVGLGQPPTLTKLIAITGGSRTTVATHLRSIRQERQAVSRDLGPPADILYAMSQPFLRNVWDAALKLASGTFQKEIQGLRLVQASLIEDLEVAQRAEEDALARATLADARLAELNRQRTLTELEVELQTMKALVTELRGTTNQTSAPALVVLLHALLGKKKPISTHDLDSIVMASGRSRATAQKARFHAVKGGYAELVGNGLKLTAAGVKKARAA